MAKSPSKVDLTLAGLDRATGRPNARTAMTRPVAEPSREVLLHSSAQLWITVLAGIREIWAHKFRSLLTMLGIILGVSSLVAMSALVAGMEKGAKEALIAIGGFGEGPCRTPGPARLNSAIFPTRRVGITLNDVHALQQSAPLVTDYLPKCASRRRFPPMARAFVPGICSGVWPVAAEMSEHVDRTRPHVQRRGR